MLMTTTIVISRSDAADEKRRAFEDQMIAALRRAGRAPVLVVPPVYSLADGDEPLEALRAVTGPILIASWLYPRAAYWVLHTLGVRGALESEDGCKDCCSSDNCFCEERTIATRNLAEFNTPAIAARKLLMLTPRRKLGEVSIREFSVPERTPWYPVIDYSLCIVCGQCHDFCLFGVYTTDDANQPRVTSPNSCKPGCAACARICPQGAIMFPLYAGDEGIAGAPGMMPKATQAIPDDLLKKGEPCPVCGCACDCERSKDGTAPPGKTVCPACGCICNPAANCLCRPARAGRLKSERKDKPRDELDDLIDDLDKLDA